MRVCPCLDCKTRTPVCHGICPSYKKWTKEKEIENLKVKKRKRQCGAGNYLDYNSSTRW